jgi:hypothetical protein
MLKNVAPKLSESLALGKEIMSCKAEDKDCAFLAFNAYRHYNPDSQFVKDTVAIQDSMKALIADCETEDPQCNALKAYAFEKVFPNSAAAKADLAKWPLDLNNEENTKMVAEIGSCMEENPLCTHLIIKEFCSLDGAASENCATMAALDEKFQALIRRCEGANGKLCEKLADNAVAKFFPAAKKGAAASNLRKWAGKIKEKLAEHMAKIDGKREAMQMAKELQNCEAEDKDCAFLVFRTYRHFFPASAFVKATTAVQDAMLGEVEACEAEDSECNSLKAYAFSQIFPDSEDAKAMLAKFPLAKNAENEKMAAEMSSCMTSNPLCPHLVMAEFCRLDKNADAACAATSALDDKFEKVIERCESDLGNFCKKLAKKGACKAFKETCKEE